MNDDELRRRLDALAGQAPDEDALLDRWEHRTTHRSRSSAPRRARTAPVLAVLVAATVLAVVGVGLSGLGDHGSPEAHDAGPATARTTEPSPDADSRARAALPEDNARVGGASTLSREVGRGRIVVRVPSRWGWLRPVCGDLTESGYFFSIGVTQACAPAPNPSVTSVRIDAVSAVPHDDDDPIADRTFDGVTYGVSRIAYGAVNVAVVIAPDEDARIVVHGSEAAVDEIVASVRVLPPSEVAVPELSLGVSGGKPGVSALSDPSEMERRLVRAGLRVRLTAVDGATRDTYDRVRVVPRVGSVVPVGSTVRVVLAGRPGS